MKIRISVYYKRGCSLYITIFILLFISKSLSASDNLKIAFGFDKPPFIFGKTGTKGFEPDLIKTILEPYGYKIESVQMSKYYLENILKEDNDFNGTSSISRQEDSAGIYYSDNFIFHENYAVTLHNRHLKISSIEDLTKINFVTWNSAWHDLGEKFQHYFNPVNGIYKDHYHDNPSQKDNIKKFFNGEYDAILIDRNTFKWYKTMFNNHEEYDYHHIFKKKKGYSCAFRSKKLRDEFNAGLNRIRKNGIYEQTINYNRTHNFYPLIEYIKLVSDISSKYLYMLWSDKLNRVLEPFLENNNILSIEIIDTKLNRVFLKVSKEYPTQPTGTITDSIVYHTDQEGLDLGKVVIVYKKDFDFTKGSPIPELSLFSDLPKKELSRIRELYEKHEYSKVKHVQLTEEEIAYLRKKGTIKVHNERSWAPYNFNENGQAKGYVIDYMNLLAQKLGIKLQYVSGYTWAQFLQLAKEGRIDVISNIVDTDKRRKFLNFTSSYDISQKAIFSNDAGYKHISDLNGKIVAVPKGFFVEGYLKKHYPKIILKRYDNVLQCITAVLNHKADALIESYGVVKYLMNRYNLIIPYMSLSDTPDLQTKLSIGVRKDEPILCKIFQKAVNSVTPEEIKRIKSKWFDIQRKEVSHFSIAQEEYLKKLHKIRYCCNPNWKPIEFVENGKSRGISINTLSLIADRLHVKLEYIPTNTWTQAQKYLKEDRCDILPAATRTEKREQYAYFTHPYLSYPIAIITRDNRPTITNFDTIADKRMARKKGSGLTQILYKKYPGLKIVETDTYEKAFEKVLNGKAYFTIATIPILAYYQKAHGLNGLKVAGYLNWKMKLSMAINKKREMLYSIINKVLSDIPPETHQIINDKWTTSQTVIKKTDYTLMFKIISVFLFIILIITIAYIKLKRLNQEIDYLNRTLKERVAEEVALNRNKDRMILHQSRLAKMGEMISMIAHQWRQPLNNLSILMQTIVIQYHKGRLSDEGIESFRRDSSMLIRQMSETIDDFRNFFRPDKEKSHFILDDIVGHVRSIMEPLLEKNSITLTVRGDHNVSLYGYPNELGQGIINLVGNAKDAIIENNAKKRDINILIQKYDKEVTVTVKDNAGGIKPEIIENIFEPYFSTKKKKNGTGLGLYISKLIIEEHMGGSLTVTNISEGASFEIRLPSE